MIPRRPSLSCPSCPTLSNERQSACMGKSSEPAEALLVPPPTDRSAGPADTRRDCGPQAGQTLTYRELDDRRESAGPLLSRRGVAPGVVVGLCLERSLNLIVGLLGILKSGGAYLPLDADYPTDRLEYMLRDSQVRVSGHPAGSTGTVCRRQIRIPFVSIRNGTRLRVVRTVSSRTPTH